MRHRIYQGDNLAVLRTLPGGCAPLIYIDPPFNTGKLQSHTPLEMQADEAGARTGFQGKRFSVTQVGPTRGYVDQYPDFLGFLEPRLREAHRVLSDAGTLYFHIDYREVHYCKVLLDQIFGRECFLNEIIWAYDYGARTKKRWPPKHDNILVYVKDPSAYTFHYDALDRIPYLAPGLVGPEKAARGKTPTSVWWHTIVPTNGKERTGYPTQKPLGILRRILSASSSPGDLVLDFFAGSGTTGQAALELGRRFLLVDQNPDAISVMRERFQGVPEVEFLQAP